ncbi:hypothetical protein EO087_08235 [Dyella sp. M7H15-1]|uniref:hypothetical protein n=1 Tax=Dyella sp. M7H15-1 TaxID=2501295 RepID=UPI001004EFBC|nr:hypothetical protein [Dyella sp. M7H15-1]QAU23981.1 hypothetical protein EO087_08235 [Dyella sp. M7H15-1]
MNVQLSSPGIGHGTLTSAGKATPIDSVSHNISKGASANTATQRISLARRSEFAARQEHINRQVTHAQRSIAFLDQTLDSLQELKASLSSSVARRATTQDTLEISLARVQAQWQTRHGATGGALGPDLSFHDDGAAQQSFQVRSLDMKSLQNERAEILTVYPRGAGKPSVSVLVDGRHRSDREWARRMDHALAASGISARITDERELTFTARESRWIELREQLMIQGNGHRFPAGRPARATAEATTVAIEPANWQTGTAAERRTTLRQVVQAIDHIQIVRDGLNHVLKRAGTILHSDSNVLASSDAAQTAATFDVALTQANDFQRFSTISAALRGLNGHRVRTVTNGLA